MVDMALEEIRVSRYFIQKLQEEIEQLQHSVKQLEAELAVEKSKAVPVTPSSTAQG
jgi:flagellar biosynthesis chaperone FliJ